MTARGENPNEAVLGSTFVALICLFAVLVVLLRPWISRFQSQQVVLAVDACRDAAGTLMRFKYLNISASSFYLPFHFPPLLRDPLIRTIPIAPIYTRPRYLNYSKYESLGCAHRFIDGDALGGSYGP